MNKKDEAFLEYLLANTQSGKLRWEPTADENEFTAAVRGEYSVAIHRNPSDRPDVLDMRNANGEVILQLLGSDDSRINGLFQIARRNAFNVDKIIDEIIGTGGDAPSS